jgi:hypothetical protein
MRDVALDGVVFNLRFSFEWVLHQDRACRGTRRRSGTRDDECAALDDPDDQT